MLSPIRTGLSVFALALAIAGRPATAAEETPWALCGPVDSGLPTRVLPASTQAGAVRLSADEARLEPSGLSLLQGNVVMGYEDKTVYADRLLYDSANRRLEAEGNVAVQGDTLTMHTDQASLDLASERGRLGESRFFYAPMHARGSAEAIEREGPGLTRLERTTYTSCNPGHDDWLLSARSVTLDEQEGQGTARDVVLRFQHVPFLYTPWISFPIDDRRKSGLLAPRFGSSSSTGLDLEVPYYLNLAPNRDATLTPRYMEKRGVQLKTEFRYLNPTNAGTVHFDYLPDDREYGTDRRLFQLDHRGQPISHLTTRVFYNSVSDANYFKDLGGSLNDTSTTFLERTVEANYTRNRWMFLGRVQKYQTVDETVAPEDRPYQRLPQLLFDGGTNAGPLRMDLYSEWVQFERDASLTGSRFDILPALSLPVEGGGYFFRPTAKLRYTEYNLTGTDPGAPDHPTRTVPITSVDTGLIFERPWSERTIQTLEPRLYYLYVPYRDQDDLPLFDTGLADFNFDLLFAEDRFNGPDRVGDADQLSIALTTRFLDRRSGMERFRLSAGQIRYFADRRVTLPGEPVEDTPDSSYAVELGAQLTSRWSLGGSLLWNPETDQSDLAAYRLQYRQDGQRVVNLAQRMRRDSSGAVELKQIDASAAWPLSRRWKGVGRWTYSTLDGQDIEALAGLEYESCCWALRVVGRKYVSGDPSNEYNSSIYIQLVLKGLTNLGQGVDQLLQRGILGYETDD